MRELQTQNPEKINVWAGIMGENIIGPFFIESNLNGEINYLALLQNNDAAKMQEACIWNICCINNDSFFILIVNGRKTVTTSPSRCPSCKSMKEEHVELHFETNHLKFIETNLKFIEANLRFIIQDSCQLITSLLE
ncbi:hypothetical protein NQ318_022862 [Aromia moschata]|uniref:Uncharacterized protein n=1 Tax=Aromia moschata TaxID=1265417 RepID=A0AAV8Y4D2_9CUCU|nr:hypothetical protein NQ318_022862 [Aromia moschata]